MVSKTSICNKALRKLGSKPVINVDTDTSQQATLCKAAYDDILDEVLREHNWNFAVARQALNKDTSFTPDPTNEFANRFILPTLPKFLKLISVLSTSSNFTTNINNQDYRLEGGFLLANEDTLTVRYVSRVTDTSRYDSIFIQALSARLAAEIAFALTSGNNLTQAMQQEYLFALSRARDVDFQEDNQIATQVSRWNNARSRVFEDDIGLGSGIAFNN